MRDGKAPTGLCWPVGYLPSTALFHGTDIQVSLKSLLSAFIANGHRGHQELERGNSSGKEARDL